MSDPQVRFSDGAAYDAMMGVWSRSVGEIFLDWLGPAAGVDWVDVGCGSGAFTELVVERCRPASITGLDPSEPQLDFARSRGIGDVARFASGDAMALSLPDASVDVAVAALVVHFMPDPERGVAEMARVTRQGGLVAAYAWDLPGGGFPYEPVHTQMRAVGSPPPSPPHPEASGTAELRRLWAAAGLVEIAQREIVVSRKFNDFGDYWRMATMSPRIAAVLGSLPAAVLRELEARVRVSLPANVDGTIVPMARANAIMGRVTT